MLEELIPLNPIHFFALQWDCPEMRSVRTFPEKSHYLPDLAKYQHDTSFADIALGWNDKGIQIAVFFHDLMEHPDFPDIQSGDSVEIFIDTRDVKTSGYTTRFCHHFFFLPAPVKTNGDFIQAGEITRFRTDDVHELCDPNSLIVKGQTKKNRTLMSIEIPSACLHGYDPMQFDRLGFTYRINRYRGYPQFFAASSDEFPIEQHPSVWASIRLMKELKA